MNIPKLLKTDLPVQGVKYLELLGTLLTDLHEAGAQRDRGQETANSFTTSMYSCSSCTITIRPSAACAGCNA